MKSLDLFSGYGGITYALRNYVRPIGYCEIEEYPRAILASRMESGELPFAPIYPDVKKLRGSFGAVDIITGGFPCQDISVAGNGKGLDGERSGLFFEIVRLTKEIDPKFVFLENVPAIRTRGLREVIRAFTEMGYDCRWTCLSASSVGAPHKRERWFLLAYANSINSRNKRKNEVQTIGQMDQRNSVIRNNGKKESLANSNSLRESSKQEDWQYAPDRSSDCGENVADSESKGLERDGMLGRHESTEPWSGGGHSVRASSDYKHNWQIEPNVGRVVDGTSFRVDRLKALGNGVVPQQVKEAFEVLMGLKVK